MQRTSLFGAVVLTLALVGCGKDDPAHTDETDTDTDTDTDSDTDSDTDTDTDTDTDVPLEREHAGGNPSGIQVDGDVAYIVVGPALETWSLADPTAPLLLGQSEPLSGVLSSVAVAGQRAYVVERKDFESIVHVVDVSDPAAPAEVGTFRTVDPAEGYSVIHALATDGARLYAADQEQGIFVFDLTNPDAPVEERVVGGTGVTDVKVVGAELHYTGQTFMGAWFGVLDTTNGFEEVRGTSLGGVKGLAMANGLLATTGLDGAIVYRFDDPWTTSEIFRYDALFARRLAALGTTAWIPADDGLHTLDLSDPSAVTRSGPVDAKTAGGDAISVTDGLLTVASDRGRLLTFDLATPTAPTLSATLDISVCTDCASLAFGEGDELYVADVAGGLRTARLSDFGALGRGDAGAEMIAIEDVAVDGAFAYVSDWFTGVRIYHVEDNAAPELLSTLITGGYVSAVAIQGDRLAAGESTNGGRLHIVDVADPKAPQILGTELTTKVRDLVFQGDLVYVADESLDVNGGLRIFDVSDPSAMEQVGWYEGCSSVIDVDVHEGLAALACASQDFHLVDVSDPSAPRQLAVWPAEGTNSAHSVAIDGTRVYLGHDTAVIAIDAADPSAPTALAEWPVAYSVRAIGVPQPGRVVAAAGLGGIYQWELEP